MNKQTLNNICDSFNKSIQETITKQDIKNKCKLVFRRVGSINTKWRKDERRSKRLY